MLGTRAINLRRFTACFGLGAAASVLLAFAGPMVLPCKGQSPHWWNIGATRGKSWLTTWYSTRECSSEPRPWRDALDHVRQLEYFDCVPPCVNYCNDGFLSIGLAGFPARSLMGYEFVWLGAGDASTDTFQRDGFVRLRELDRGTWDDDPPYVLFYPIPAGLAFNAGCFGLAVWLPVVTLCRVKYLRRQRARLCLRCGYDLTATSRELPCPECGKVQLLFPVDRASYPKLLS